ncbi:DUF3786 domain-containing protein [Desulfofustis glycolicus]|uniref:DUF3786 domain-containing protein n=1 Tax=Desulfofustis glycolicus DSM 9705 TaxID=1121409 RepID=A0A1M5YKD4_9BACT|nr:DUF3786 domain-containing protein [Desulfofustis glycolicus]SHI11973.1 protein of unknown function [Desulfofustis glycolicus DSM 9705]
MTALIDKAFFQELSGQDPREVCRRAVCTYDDTERSYALTVWGEQCTIHPHQARIEYVPAGRAPFHPYLELLMIHYLLRAQAIEPTQAWVSEKDLPGGATFFRGPHEIPTSLITGRFNDDVDSFKNRCKHLMGTPLDLADAAFSFTIAPRVPVAILYWAGDDDFPAESKILYDRSIAEPFALDVIYALAVGICERVGSSNG